MSHPTSALTAPTNTRFRALVPILALFIFIALVPAAYGQADLSFTGGNGTPLTTTLTRSVSYTVTNANCAAGNGPFFDFDEVGNTFASTQNITGTIVYSVNAGASQALTYQESNYTGGDVSANDHSLYGSLAGVGIGTTVVLSLGSITTAGNVAAAPPANGSFTTFLTDGNGFKCSTNGVAINPSAANVSIAGRVLAPGGRGLQNAQVVLTDGQGNTRMAVTSTFGAYRFEGVAAGEAVVLTVRSKRYYYAPMFLNVEDGLTNVDFTPGQ